MHLLSFMTVFSVLIIGCSPELIKINKPESGAFIEISKPEPGAFIEIQCPETKERKIKYLGFVKNFNWAKEYRDVLGDKICNTKYKMDDTKLGFYNCQYEIRAEDNIGNNHKHISVTKEKVYVSDLIPKSNMIYIEIDANKNEML